MDSTTRDFVRRRANGRCEYCHLSQSAASYYSFHIEHIVARQHQGSDDESNLANALDVVSSSRSLLAPKGPLDLHNIWFRFSIAGHYHDERVSHKCNDE
jgi:hypothetical protein